jgi:cytochrome bd-type quinol oxidase subunit 2
MIQRIQTIFLALAALASGGLFGLPFATTQEAEANSGLFADSVYNINDHLVLLITFLLAGIFSLVAIFLFKKRKLQMSLSMMAIFASIIGLAYGLFIFLSDPASEQAGFGLGFLPFWDGATSKKTKNWLNRWTDCVNPDYSRFPVNNDDN